MNYDNQPLDQPPAKKKTGKVKMITAGLLAGMAGIAVGAVGAGSATDGPSAASPASTATVTATATATATETAEPVVETVVENNPDCLLALDLAEEVVGITVNVMDESGKAMELIPRALEAGQNMDVPAADQIATEMELIAVNVGDHATTMEPVAQEYRTAADSCRYN